MRKIILFAFLLLAARPARATLTLVQHPTSNCGACTSATFTLTQATGAGHLLVLVASGTNGNSGNWSTITNEGTFTIDTGCRTGNGTAFVEVICAYLLSSTGGASTLSLSWTASNNWRYTLLEYSFTGSSVSFDTSSTLIHTSASTSQVGPNLTLTGTNDVVVNFMGDSGSATTPTVAAPYTLEGANTGSSQAFASADNINTNSGTGATFTTGNTSSIVSAIAFKEIGGGGGKPPGQFPRVYGK